MEPTLAKALDIILAQPSKGYIAYAQTYASAAKQNPYTGEEMTGNELRTQLLYVSSNLGDWHGEEAKEVKEVLKRFSKEPTIITVSKVDDTKRLGE
jgi:hypothetical protein